MRSRRQGILTLVLLAAVLAAPPRFAQNDPERDQAEARLQEVLAEIGEVEAELRASRTRQGTEQARLRNLDLAIQEATGKYRTMERDRDVQLGELRTLEQDRNTYLSSLERRMDQLAEQLRAAYRNSGQSRIRLVLNQDDPARIGRLLAYYDYMNRAQLSRISGLKTALEKLDTMQRAIDLQLADIAVLQAQQQEILDRLDQQRDERVALLSRLAGQIQSGEAELRELQKNRRDLETLIERLADILADIPPELDRPAGISQLKGRLPMPVAGPVHHAFGQQRTGSLRWQGWLIGAERGTVVTSVAHGRVAFADWLRGYGLLLIIDHGKGFMSLYGHNESLLREAGAWVDAGEEVGIVGDNPGSGQGLYFELRRDGRAIDPAAWLAR